jgi:hypothetical protein
VLTGADSPGGVAVTCRYSHGVIGASKRGTQAADGDTYYQLPPRVEFDNYKASYFMCDERSRDVWNRNHVARAFAEPTEHGQCWHHRVAFQ